MSLSLSYLFRLLDLSGSCAFRLPPSFWLWNHVLHAARPLAANTVLHGFFFRIHGKSPIFWNSVHGASRHVSFPTSACRRVSRGCSCVISRTAGGGAGFVFRESRLNACHARQAGKKKREGSSHERNSSSRISNDHAAGVLKLGRQRDFVHAVGRAKSRSKISLCLRILTRGSAHTGNAGELLRHRRCVRAVGEVVMGCVNFG